MLMKKSGTKNRVGQRMNSSVNLLLEISLRDEHAGEGTNP
jgi:hypothetical protein